MENSEKVRLILDKLYEDVRQAEVRLNVTFQDYAKCKLIEELVLTGKLSLDDELSVKFDMKTIQYQLDIAHKMLNKAYEVYDFALNTFLEKLDGKNDEPRKS